MTTSHTFDDRVDEVSSASATGPSLVTFAVPPEQSIDAALERIEEEHASAEYIDADETSERATEALETVRRIVHDYDEIPANGLVIYAGVVDGETVEYVFDDLPSAVAAETFVRSNEFDLSPLDVTVDEETYGLLVVEHGEATLGRFSGTDIDQIQTFEGDWREENPTEGALGDREQVHREFFERVAEKAAETFLGEEADELEKSEADPGESDIDPVEGLFVGGSTVTATEFLEENYLDHRLQNRVVTDAFEVEDATQQGLEQLASEARDHLEKAERAAIEEHLDEFYAELGGGEEAVAGQEATEEALEYEAVATTLASESLPAEDLRTYEQQTVAQGGEFVVVPTDVERGEQFEAETSIGAVLRFPIE